MTKGGENGLADGTFGSRLRTQALLRHYSGHAQQRHPKWFREVGSALQVMSTLREDSTAENLIQIAQNYLEFQNLPISEPDPIPRRNFHKKSASGKATVRGF